MPENLDPGRQIVSQDNPEGASADSQVSPDPGSRPYVRTSATPHAGLDARSPSCLPSIGRIGQATAYGPQVRQFCAEMEREALLAE